MYRSASFSEWLLSTWNGAKEAEDRVHATPNPGAREGVPLQSLSYEKAADRDSPYIGTIGETD